MCCVPARHHACLPSSLEIKVHVRPAVSTNGAKIVTSRTEGTGTSTSCSAICGERRTESEKRAVASERCSTTGAGDSDTAGAGAIKSTMGAGAGNTAGVGEKCSITGASDWKTAGAGATYSTTSKAWITASAGEKYSTTGEEAWNTAGTGPTTSTNCTTICGTTGSRTSSKPNPVCRWIPSCARGS